MSVTLRKRTKNDGTITFRLDIYENGRRYYETLKHLKLVKPVTPIDRQKNKDTLAIAQSIALARSRELEANNYDVHVIKAQNVYVVAWMQSYVDAYPKKDKRNFQAVLNNFKLFLKGKDITFKQLDVTLIEDFIDYLQHKFTGEGPKSYFARFNRMLKQAVKRKIIRVNPYLESDKKVKGRASVKDFLTMDEIRILRDTPVSNDNVRRAAIFSAVTGLAWIDVKTLTWEQIHDGYMRIVRTKQANDNYSFDIPLNETALGLLGTPSKGLVFNLPTADGANKVLKGWVENAGITKKITWHNLRHSFGTNLIINGVDLLTTSRLMVHTSTHHTARYIKTVESMKIEATNKINL